MTVWFILAGAIALLMAYVGGLVRRMPLSASIVYLVIGYVLGPDVAGILVVDPSKNSHTIRSLTEIIIIVSIFSGALKLRLTPLHRMWLLPVRLASLSMAAGVGALAASAHYLFGLPIGTALLIGAILAPTDPVLASDVQVERPYSLERLRFTLTGEAGMNDGAALPFVAFALAVLGVDPIEHSFGLWFAQTVLWGGVSAVAIGGFVGYFGSRYLLHLRFERNQKLGTENFLALGIIALSFAITNAVHGIGFVAVFAAGVAARQTERRKTTERPETIELTVGAPPAEQSAATDRKQGPALMLMRMESFTASLEQIGGAVVVVLVGSMLQNSMLGYESLLFSALLFFVVRPFSVFLGLAGSGISWIERMVVSWFGIRGMASVYYIASVHEKGNAGNLVHRVAPIVLGVVTYSILVHGITVTPVMHWFETRRDTSQGGAKESSE